MELEETMAVTKKLAKSFRLDRLINYVINGDKTEDRIYVSSVACDPDNAYKTMMETKRFFRNTDGVQAYHIIQSFMPNEVSAKVAHEIANRFVKRYLEGYEVVVGTHVDKEHIHNHITFNSVSDETGLKYHSSPASYYKHMYLVQRVIKSSTARVLHIGRSIRLILSLAVLCTPMLQVRRSIAMTITRLSAKASLCRAISFSGRTSGAADAEDGMKFIM